MYKNQLNADIQAFRNLSLQSHATSDGLNNSHAEYVVGNTWQDMVEKDLDSERVAIQTYKDMLASLGDEDPTTRQMLKEILFSAEKQAEELTELLTIAQ